MKLNRKELILAMQKVLPATSDGNFYVTGADTILFTPNTINAYNDNLSASVKFQTDLTGTVKAKDFFKLLQKLGTEEIDIEQASGKWLLTSGSTQAEINLKEDALTPYVEVLDVDSVEFQDLPENFMTGMVLCKIPSNSSFLRGLFVKGIDMCSTDEIRMNFFELEAEMPCFWIDDPAVNELLKLPEKLIGYSVAPGWIHFQGESDTILSCKRNQESAFPIDKLLTYRGVYEQTPDDLLQSLPKNFQTVVDRVAVMHTDIDGYQAINFHIQKDKITISSKTESGSVQETLKWDTPFPKKIDVEFLADFSFLKEAYLRCPDFFVREDAEKAVDVVFQGEGFTQIMRTISK